MIQVAFFRSSHLEVFRKKCVLKNFTKFTRKLLCQRYFVVMMVCLLQSPHNKVYASWKCFCNFSAIRFSANLSQITEQIFDNSYHSNKYKGSKYLIKILVTLSLNFCLLSTYFQLVYVCADFIPKKWNCLTRTVWDYLIFSFLSFFHFVLLYYHLHHLYWVLSQVSLKLPELKLRGHRSSTLHIDRFLV